MSATTIPARDAAVMTTEKALAWSFTAFALISPEAWQTALAKLPWKEMSESDCDFLSSTLSEGEIDEFTQLPLIKFVLGAFKKKDGSYGASNRYFKLNEMVEKYPDSAALLLLLAECHLLLEDYSSGRLYLGQVRLLIPFDETMEEAFAAVCALAQLEADDDVLDEDYPDDGWVVKRYTRPMEWEPSSTPSNLVGLHCKWVQLQQLGDGTEQFARYASVATNELEGVFRLKADSSKRLARCGLMLNSIVRISRTSRNKNPDKILSIIRNTQECYSMITGVVSGTIAFNEALLLKLNRKLLDRDNIDSMFDADSNIHQYTVVPMGRYRETPSFADNDDHKRTAVFCPPSKIKEEMEFFWEQVEAILGCDDIDPFRASATLQYIFLRIHPFADGNGRVGRIISSIPLLKADLPPVIVSLERKNQYFRALEYADDFGDIDELARFLQKESFQAIQELLGYNPKNEFSARIQKKKSPVRIAQEKIRNQAASESDSS